MINKNGAVWLRWPSDRATVLLEAERRGEIPESAYPGPAAHDGLSADEVVAGIALAFGADEPALARRSDRGPRDVGPGSGGVMTDEAHEEIGP